MDDKISHLVAFESLGNSVVDDDIFSRLNEHTIRDIRASFGRIHLSYGSRLFIHEIQPCRSEGSSIYNSYEGGFLTQDSRDYIRALVGVLTDRRWDEGKDKYVRLEGFRPGEGSIHTSDETNSVQVLREVLIRAYPPFLTEWWVQGWEQLFHEGDPELVGDALWHIADKTRSAAAFYVSACNVLCSRVEPCGGSSLPLRFIPSFYAVYSQVVYFDEIKKHAANLVGLLYGEEALVQSEFILRTILQPLRLPVLLSPYDFEGMTLQADRIINDPGFMPDDSDFLGTPGLLMSREAAG